VVLKLLLDLLFNTLIKCQKSEELEFCHQERCSNSSHVKRRVYMASQKQSDETRKEMMTKIVARAWKDPEFKKKLLSNPKSALRDMNISLPENKEGRILEEEPNVVTIFLPKRPANAPELSEKELAVLAGGGAWADAATLLLGGGGGKGAGFNISVKT
jgi:hypothetical protein